MQSVEVTSRRSRKMAAAQVATSCFLLCIGGTVRLLTGVRGLIKSNTCGTIWLRGTIGVVSVRRILLLPLYVDYVAPDTPNALMCSIRLSILFKPVHSHAAQSCTLQLGDFQSISFQSALSAQHRFLVAMGASTLAWSLAAVAEMPRLSQRF